MRFNTTIACSLAMIGACAGQAPVKDAWPVADVTAFHGVWDLTADSAFFVPPSCRDTSIEITESTFAFRSGRLHVFATYEPVTMDSRVMFRLSDVRHNGEKNCRQLAADRVVSRITAAPVLALVGGKLRYYEPRRRYLRYFELERRPERTDPAP